MKSIRAKRPSPAMVVASIALVVAVTGTAVATTSKLAGPEVRQVVRIANKRITKRAPNLSVAHARTADNAVSLAGAAASSYVSKSDLAPLPVEELALHPGWASIGVGSGPGPARGYRDQLGTVHLAGLIARFAGGDNFALTLPGPLRPAYDLEFPAVCDEPGLIFNPRPGIVVIESDGDVRPISTSGSDCYERLSLDGISFRAGD
ncbi:MAG TPA: hypothetical protein VH476_07780 [Solirubrobacterales bacterium]|jgi:hypothetical protein